MSKNNNDHKAFQLIDEILTLLTPYTLHRVTEHVHLNQDQHDDSANLRIFYDIEDKDESEEEQSSILWELVYSKKWKEIVAFLKNGDLTISAINEVIESQRNQEERTLLWEIVAHGKWPLFELLLERDLVTRKGLEVAPRDGDYKGKNTLCWLVKNKQWPLIEFLLQKDLITEAALEQKAESEDIDAGKNILWQIAVFGEWNLLKKLVELDLVTEKGLAVFPNSGDYMGENVVFLIVMGKRWEEFNALLEKGLITSQLLNQPSLRGKNTGKNAVFLIVGSKLNLIKKLLEKQLITREQLLSSPLMLGSKHYGENCYHKIASNRNWPILTSCLSLNSSPCLDNMTVFQIRAGIASSFKESPISNKWVERVNTHSQFFIFLVLLVLKKDPNLIYSLSMDPISNHPPISKYLSNLDQVYQLLISRKSTLLKEVPVDIIHNLMAYIFPSEIVIQKKKLGFFSCQIGGIAPYLRMLPIMWK